MKKSTPRLQSSIAMLLCTLLCAVRASAQLTLTGTTQIEAGYYVTLYPSALGGSWGTSNPGVATVDRGLVRGLTAGTATISYTQAGTTVTQNVTVNPATTFCATWQGQNGMGFESMTLNRTGTPYMLYRGSTGKAYVKKYNGTTWSLVGSASFSPGTIVYHSMDIKVSNDGTPYVTFIDETNGNKVSVMKYDGTSWTSVGSYGISSRQATYCQLAIDSTGTVYLAYDEYSVNPSGGFNYSTNDTIKVKKYNGSTWENVGTPNAFLAPLTLVADDQLTRFSFKLDNNGSPILAYPFYSQVEVIKYNGSNWASLGATPSTYANMVNMAISRNNIPYVVYLDNLWHPNVMKYSGGGWSTIGDLSSSYAEGSSNVGNLVAIAVDANEVPYVSYKSYIEGQYVINKRYVGGAWESTGQGGGWSGIGLMFDGDGTLWGYSSVDVTTLFRTRRTSGLSANVGGPTVCSNTDVIFSNPVYTSPSGGWTSSDPSVLALNSFWGPSRFTANNVGTATITFTNGTCSTSTNVTVTPTPTVTATTTSITAGTTTTLSGTPAAGTWTSSNTTIATVGSGNGIVTGVAAGTSKITYTSGTCLATQIMTVTSSITGSLIVTGTGNTVLTSSIPGGTWSTSCSEIATIASDGTVTGVSNGLATISYTVSGSSTTAVVTVNSTTTAITGSLSVCAASTSALGHPVSGGTWSSSNTAKATVNASTGVVTGVAAGTSNISYAYGNGCTSVATVTVNPLPHAGTITGPDSICQSLSVTLTATGDAGGVWSMYELYSFPTATINATTGVMTPNIMYDFMGVTASLPMYKVTNGCGTDSALKLVAIVSSNPGEFIIGPSHVCVGAEVTFSLDGQPGYWIGSSSLAIDSATGVATAVAPGVTYLMYAWYPSLCSSEWVWPAMWVTVDSTVATNPTISGPLGVQAGNSMTWSAIESGGTWSVSNSHVTVSAAGVVTGVSAGTAIISYTINDACGTRRGTSTIMVIPPSIGGPLTVTGSGNVTLTNSAAGGTWSSACNNVATVAAGGVVTGVSAGMTTVTYTVNGAYTTAVVTVNGATTAITGSLAVCTGANTSLAHPVSGGAWTSSNTAKATVNASTGVVTGVAAGTANISYVYGSSCTSVATVTVNPHPYAGVISSVDTFCQDDYVTFSSSVGGGKWVASLPYYFFVDSVTGVGYTPSYMYPTIYAAILPMYYVVTNSCGSDTASKWFTVMPRAYGSITGPDHLCVGATATYSFSTPGGHWSVHNPSTGAIDTSATIDPTTGVLTTSHSGNISVWYEGNTYCGDYWRNINITIDSALTPMPTISGATSVQISHTIALSASESGGTWSVSNGNASVTSTGLVTGTSAGTVVVSYSLSSLCGTAVGTSTVTVTPPPIGGGLMVTGSGNITLTNTVTGGTWSSACSNVATVAAGGVVTGVSSGMTTVTYTVNGAYTTAVVTVNGTTTAITGSLAVCTGANTSLAHPVSVGAWTSSNPGVASITSTGYVSGASVGTTTITYNYGSGCASLAVVTVSPAPDAGTISGAATVAQGSSTTLTNTVTGGAWSASNGNATVSGGVVTGAAAGTVVISYTVTGGCGNAVATKTITVTSTAPSGTLAVCSGSSTVLTNGIPGGVWTSGNNSIASVGSATGVVTGAAPGVVNISYTVGGVVTTASVTVNALPQPITGTLSLCEGATTALSSTTTGGAWTSGNTTAATAGATGVVSGLTAGNSAITYTAANGCYRTTTVTVVAQPSVTGTTTMCAGSTTTLLPSVTGGAWGGGSTAATVSNGVVTGVAAGGAYITYTIGGMCRSVTLVTVNALPASIAGTAKACPGATVTLTDATTGGSWSSANSSVATADAAIGAITGIMTGTAVISYTGANGCNRTIVMTVNASPAAIGGTASACAGSTTTLSDASPVYSWTSGNTGVATITSGGVVTGVSAGTATITFMANATWCTTTAVVTINGTPAAIGGAATACIGASTALTNTVTGGTWTSSNSSIISVDATTGIVTGIATGNATITYTTGSGCYKTKAMTVGSANAITGYTTVCVGTSTSLTSWGTGTWSSSDASIATVPTSTGAVTGMNIGTATITFTPTTGCAGTAVVTVVAAPGAITGTTSICSGQSSSLSNGSTGGYWSSSNTATATIGSTTGVVNGVGSAGTVTITYAYNATCRATTTFTVKALPAVITGTYSVCASAITTLNDVTAGGVWSSSNTTVATVGSGLSWGQGVVSGLSAGTTTISFTIPTGCARSIVVTVDPCSRPMGNEQSAGYGVQLYPNPTTGTITLATEIDGMLAIFTMDGKQVSAYPIAKGINNLALPNVAAGVYMCRFSGNDGNTTVVRLVVQ